VFWGPAPKSAWVGVATGIWVPAIGGRGKPRLKELNDPVSSGLDRISTGPRTHSVAKTRVAATRYLSQPVRKYSFERGRDKA